MKFKIERGNFIKMLKRVGKKLPGERWPDDNFHLLACSGHVFVESNGIVAGIEAVVAKDGECLLPRKKFLELLDTYSGKRHLKIEADKDSIAIEDFTMKVLSYSSRVVAPSKFEVYPIPDRAAVFLDKSSTTKVEAPDGVPARRPRLEWRFFAPEILERLFLVYPHRGELAWAERNWGLLEARGLTNYSTAAEYNRVLVRLAVLARYFKCWVWKAYGDWGDPYWDDYDAWFDVLPFVQSELLSPASQEIGGQRMASTESERDLLTTMIREENDAVFDAVIASCGDLKEMTLAVDLRHAAGVGDDFNAHAKYTGDSKDIANQKRFFQECGLSMREFDCATVVIGNRFCF